MTSSTLSMDGPGSAATVVPRGVVAAAVAGNALEFFDFLTYSFFAVYIGKAFFPSTSEFTSLLAAVGVFGVGFVSRPIGGILIGAYADKAGRRPAMMLTIALITLGTLAMVLTPTYASIGMAAPLLIVVCRLVQGLALGGEVGPSTAFLVEIAPPGQRGLYGSWQLASQGIAICCAGLLGVLVSKVLSPDQMQAWGWRIPFALGLLMVPVALYLRRAMPETLHDSGSAKAPPAPAGELRRHSGLIVLGVLVMIGATVSTYVNSYMTTFAMTTLHFAPTISLAATVAVGASTFVFALVGGWMSDRYGRTMVMLVPRIACALLTYPAFLYLVDQKTPSALIEVSVFLAALTGISGAASISAIPELLPRSIRASGLSIAYAVGVALFGGSTQFIITWLLHATGNPTSPSWWVVITSIITAVAIIKLPKSTGKMLA